jgi:hypothetical protein
LFTVFIAPDARASIENTTALYCWALKMSLVAGSTDAGGGAAWRTRINIYEFQILICRRTCSRFHVEMDEFE